MRILSILFLTLVMFSSCTKESTETALDITPTTEIEDTGAVEPLFNPQSSQNSANIKERIKMFSNRINAVRKGETGAKDGELSVADATWNVEALLNASYANAATSFSKTEKGEYTFSVPVTDGNINNEDLLGAFETARVNLATQYEAIDSDFKMPIYIDLKEENVTNTRVDYKVTNLIAVKPGSGSTMPPPADCDIFDPVEDFWDTRVDSGRCCAGCTGDEEEDATDQLERELNERYNLPSTHLYFTNLDETYFDLNPIFGGSDNSDLLNPDWDGVDPCRKYLMWARNNDEAEPCSYCISPSNLDWYYCNMYDLVNFYVPDGYDFLSIDVEYTHLSNSDPFRLHNGFIIYGESISCFDCQPCPPSVPDCPCLTYC